MKRYLIMPILILMMSVGWAQGNTTRRVKFAPKRSSAIVKGTVKCGDTITYLIGVKAGQKMSLHLSSRTVAFRLRAPSGQELQGGKAINNVTENAEETGDYAVAVECWHRQKASYALEVVIQ